MLTFYVEEIINDDEELIDEGIFDNGFNALRAKVAEYFDGKFEVTKVFRDMFGKDSFQVVDNEDDEKLSFSSTGTGVACRGHFNNVSLSAAFNKIIDTVEDCLVGA